MSWRPPSGFDEFDGCIWLPRLISKARRVIETRSGNLFGEYMFGENDPADAELLRFLRVSAAQVLDVVQVEADDRAAAERVLALSGKTRETCERFSRRFRRGLGLFLLMIDADENRAPRGARTALLRFVYNRVIMPPAYAYFHWMERRSVGSGRS